MMRGEEITYENSRPVPSTGFDYDAVDAALSLGREKVHPDTNTAEVIRAVLWIIAKGGHADSSTTRLAATCVIAGIYASAAEAARHSNLPESSISRATPKLSKLFRQVGVALEALKTLNETSATEILDKKTP